MNRQLLLTIFACIMWYGFGLSAANLQPEEEIIEIKSAFIPVGFDNNDQVQIAVSGVLTDSCYRTGPTLYTIDEKTGVISLKQVIYDYSKVLKLCMRIEMPFNQVVDLGIISKSRDYTVKGVTKALEKKLGILSIVNAPHPDREDERLYAQVTEAFLKKTADGKAILVMTGLYSPTCMVLNKPEKNVFPASKVLVVLPTWKVREGNEKNCTTSEVDLSQFTIEEEIDSLLIGSYMIHIRTYHGKSINLFPAFSKKRDPR